MPEIIYHKNIVYMPLSVCKIDYGPSPTFDNFISELYNNFIIQ